MLMLGVKTWRYGLICPLSESIRRTADLGFGFIDLNFHLIRHNEKVYYWPKEIAPNSRSEVKQSLRDCHMKAGIVIPKTPLITSASLGFVKIDDIAELSDIPEEEALSFPFRLKLGITVARDVGAQLLDDIHLPSMGRWADIDQLKSIINSVDLLDIRVGLENRGDTDPKKLFKSFQELNLRNVGLTFDVGHAYNYFENSDQVAEQIRELNMFIYHVHIHETSKDNPSPAFGFGDINWIKIIQVFKSIGYDGALTLETNPQDRYILAIPPHPDPEVLRYKWIMEYLLKEA